MSIHTTPELEAKLNEVARRTGRDVNLLVQEALEHFVEHDSWFAAQVAEGMAQLDRGEFVPHDVVGERLNRLLRS